MELSPVQMLNIAVSFLFSGGNIDLNSLIVLHRFSKSTIPKEGDMKHWS